MAKAAMHGLSRSAITKVQGGHWSAGFWSGFASDLFSPGTKLGGDNAGGFTLRTSIAAVVGGTVSQNTGGKFANGAVSGAFTYMFNAEMAKSLNQKELEIMRQKAEANALSMDKSVSSWRTPNLTSNYKVRSDLTEINEMLESNIGKINNVGIAGASIGANYGKSFGKGGVMLGVSLGYASGVVAGATAVSFGFYDDIKIYIDGASLKKE